MAIYGINLSESYLLTNHIVLFSNRPFQPIEWKTRYDRVVIVRWTKKHQKVCTLSIKAPEEIVSRDLLKPATSNSWTEHLPSTKETSWNVSLGVVRWKLTQRVYHQRDERVEHSEIWDTGVTEVWSVCVGQRCGMGEMWISLCWRMIWSGGLTSNLFHHSPGTFLSAGKNHPYTHAQCQFFIYDLKITHLRRM